MPGALPHARIRLIASSIFGTTAGFAVSPVKPNEAWRSAGPMNTPSTPSTFAIASRLSRPGWFSTWTSTQSSSCARFA